MVTKNNVVAQAAQASNAHQTAETSPSGSPSNLAYFVGAWQLNRQILQSSGEVFVFEGQADFSWAESDLHYHESGVVTAPDGRTLQAERTYVWRQQAGGKIEVLFDDNRYFHTFSAAEPYAKHLCGDDLYVVSYALEDGPRWESTWQVKGPRKDYKMTSLYKRA
ncbi:hypothetical protein GMES_2441 [Paraglaciecola mesophila KMM 241]|uniref:DUF6314 domain-containing protein n=1 Tax=Paraglaciecola mesophila KMM 241 TaxID=1128912 RepID=K6YL44_9ALTE|nr:DUF6314 family protein [Paraglaciecola mesophila]GAC24736.1 hypothetical protein GMES_2441 [Paraglaciecola mesophila KMM 241]